MRLHARQICIERSGRRVLHGLSFSTESGVMLAITGANGAGKSTLLRAIAGLLPLTSGEIICEGLESDTTLPTHAHYLGHVDALKSALSAQENLTFWAHMLGGGGISPLKALAALALAHVAEYPVAYLSAGQKRRVALARLLVAKRPVWLLDEPTTALDVQSQALFAQVLRAHLADGGMVLAATHAPLGIEGARELRLGAAVGLQPTVKDHVQESKTRHEST